MLSTRRVPCTASGSLHGLRLLQRLFDGTHHVEGLLGQIIVIAVQNALEAGDGVAQGHVLARGTGEHLGHVEGLGQEELVLSGPVDDELVLFGQLVDALDGDDVLQFFVSLRGSYLHVAPAYSSAKWKGRDSKRPTFLAR